MLEAIRGRFTSGRRGRGARGRGGRAAARPEAHQAPSGSTCELHELDDDCQMEEVHVRGGEGMGQDKMTQENGSVAQEFTKSLQQVLGILEPHQTERR